jgi:hypothetical protein
MLCSIESRKGWAVEKDRMGGGKGPNGLQAKEAGQLKREIRQWTDEALWFHFNMRGC